MVLKKWKKFFNAWSNEKCLRIFWDLQKKQRIGALKVLKIKNYKFYSLAQPSQGLVLTKVVFQQRGRQEDELNLFQSHLIFGNKTGFSGNNLANVDRISMNMRDMRSMKVFKIFSKFQKIRWKNFQVHKNSSGTYIAT